MLGISVRTLQNYEIDHRKASSIATAIFNAVLYRKDKKTTKQISISKKFYKKVILIVRFLFIRPLA